MTKETYKKLEYMTHYTQADVDYFEDTDMLYSNTDGENLLWICREEIDCHADELSGELLKALLENTTKNINFFVLA